MKTKWKNMLFHPGVTAGIFVLAILLLLFSGIGGTRAALTYFSDNYTSRIQMYDIGVTLVENEKNISWRDYSGKGDGKWDENIGVLLENMLQEGESLQLGKAYPEELKVTNSGAINQYVRVSIYKYWLDKNGNKLQNLSPDLIDLHLVNLGSDWILDKASSTEERTVLYYNKLLYSGTSTPLFADSLAIDNMVASKVTQDVKKEGNYTVISTVYDYDGLTFCVEAAVDAVQEHNAKDAVLSAWGREITIGNGTLHLQ